MTLLIVLTVNQLDGVRSDAYFLDGVCEEQEGRDRIGTRKINLELVGGL